MMLGRLFAIAKRNTKRHKPQAIAAAAAVAVGTMVLAASLLAGTAAQAGITEIAYDVLDHTDQTIRTEGDFFFPQPAAERFAQETHQRAPHVADSPTILPTGIAQTQQGNTEPDTMLIGLPPDEENFGTFHPHQGPHTLTETTILANKNAKDALNLQTGDTLTLHTPKPLDPLVPTIHTHNGTVTSAASNTLPLDAPPFPGDPNGVTTERFDFHVQPDATRLTAILAWQSPENTTDLDLTLTAPNGTTYHDTQGAPGDPNVPIILNATATPGEWTAHIQSTAAIEQPFQLIILELAPAYDLDQLREGRETIERLGPIADRIDRLAGTLTFTARVDGIVTNEGKGGFTGEPALFFPLERLQHELERPNEINVIRTSNPGDEREGLHHTPDVMPPLEDALEATQQAHPEPSVQALNVETTKADIVEHAQQAGSDFTRFLTTLSSFTIVAGLLLVVNLFTMLGQERRVEMSVMRALGMKRSHLTASMTLEGTLYAIPGAIIGSILGLGLAYVLIEAINRFIVGPDALPIPFIADLPTVALSAAIGLIVTGIIVAATGYRLSRLHIASGLKDRQDPPNPNRSRPAHWLLGTGVLLSALHIPTGWFTLLLLGPAALLAGAIAWIGRSWNTRNVLFLASTSVVAYGLWTVVGLELPSSEAPYMIPTRGVLLVIMGVIALINLPGLPTALSWASQRLGRFSPAALVASSYPTRKQLRTGLTASMFALILLVLIFFSTFFAVFEVDPEREAGGFDVYAETRLPIEGLEPWAEENLEGDPSVLDSISTSHALPTARLVGGDAVTIDGRPVQYHGPPVDVFYGITPGFAEENAYELVSRAEPFESDQEAYEAVSQDPESVIVSRVYDVDETGRLGAVQGGEQLTLEMATRSFNFTVEGAQSQQYLGGIFLEEDTVRDLFPGHGTAFLITVQDGEDPSAVADELERAFAHLGLSADDIRAEARDIQELNARFYTVLQVFLGLGLVIGVASLGIVTAKSALEREHELGVLRAMGLPGEHVQASLVGEGLLTAMLGILPGIFIGIAAAYASWLGFFQAAGVPFQIPWLSILGLTLFSLAATLLSTVPPARRAAKVDTAQAVRVEA